MPTSAYPLFSFVATSRTSRAAAVAAEPSAGSQRARVLDALRAHPAGLTDHELQERLGLNPSTQRPRRIELVRAGLVVDSGEERETPSGRRAVVWVATGQESK